MKKWLKISFWVVFVSAVIALLVYTENQHNLELTEQPLIDIKIEGEDAFLNEEEVMRILHNAHLIYDSQTFEELHIDNIETRINAISQVKHAEVFQNVTNQWQIDIQLRKPIARVFNKENESYYLDSEGYQFATTSLHTAHCVIVTGEIKDRIDTEDVPTIINNDSLISIRKLDDVYRISNYVCNDPVFHSLIGQINLEKNGDFRLIPLVGDQIIIFGSAYSEEEVSDKFNKLKIFYEEAIANEGWNKYSEISLKYDDQIVCKKRAVY